MSHTLWRFTLVGIVLFELALARDTRPVAAAEAQPEEPIKQMPKSEDATEGTAAEPLPLPHEVQAETIVPDDFYGFRPPTRINRYEIWQFYEVDRYGQFRPRVIYSPHVSYYLYDGRPFPWISTHQLEFMPRVIGP